ncbi:hypothetical protein QC761_202198 [Podospora bellae-mahoneyi]|uniref:DUF952 domain-containing protein n=1 Tax=Podospora bellae-mahoneyi TaxID=2093777 RepID=A0ABR0FQX5_9PEZI|nr:hypothetical protein QC761_202198 [Podospora bellae-mahoneyi]
MSGQSPPSPLPTYVYKIIPSAPPSPIPDFYPLSDLDRQDGFVHLSTARQVPITSSLFFTSFKSFHILKLRLSNFPQESVKWDEVPGTNGCPHLYGNFGAKDVVDSKEFVRGDDQTWEDVLRGDSWLE